MQGGESCSSSRHGKRRSGPLECAAPMGIGAKSQRKAAEATVGAPSYSVSPSPVQHFKENWQTWKSKMMKKNNGEKKKQDLYVRRVALEEDVAQLQTQLKTERAVRQGLERALGHSKKVSTPQCLEVPSSAYSPKAKELITEIASLETEVASLEQHVLSLYRKVLDAQLSASASHSEHSSGPVEIVPDTPRPSIQASQPDSAQIANALAQPRLFSRLSLKRKSQNLSSSQHRRNGSSPGTPNNEPEDRIVNGSSFQSKSRHVSLLGGAFNCIDGSSAEETSQQLIPSPLVQELSYSIPEPIRIDKQLGGSSRETTKKELFAVLPRSAPLPLLGPSGSRSAPPSERGSSKLLYPESPRFYAGSPNRLSEELVRCMAGIYCKLADPSLSQSSGPISPASSSSSSASSSTATSSPRGYSCESWSPRWGAPAAADVSSRLTDPFQVKDRKGDVVGAYNLAVEVSWICVDKERLNYAARALRDFRLMVEQLESVDPGLMRNDEKTAFWINVYNALMMHAYLAYGIPRSHLKRVALVQKASYKIGPHSINAHTIEYCILGCRARKPTQWIHTLFTTGPRFKAGDERKAYAIEKPEPLVCFALCCGIRSDPAIRVYSAKNVRQELETARREYLQASIGIRTGSRVLLPKVLEWYSREMSMNAPALLEWASQQVSEQQQAAIKQCLHSRPNRSAANWVEWLPYNSDFRYIFMRDLARIAPLVNH